MLPFLKVCVIHNEHTISMLMSPDQTFFVSAATLNLVKNKSEAELALLISHELGHYLLDHNVTRLRTSLLNKTFIYGSGLVFRLK